MKFDRKIFFDGFRQRLDATIEQGQVDGLEFLLGRLESDPHWKDLRHTAYALATVFHETAYSFQPVEEGYYLGTDRKVKAHQKSLRYFPFFGRGYVQLTWRKNYEKAGKALGIDFINSPGLALVPDHAFDVLTLGLFRGWFGGKLTTYINDKQTDYVNARKCVNVLDKAGIIAGYAGSFEKILRASLVRNPTATVEKPAEIQAPDKLDKEQSAPTAAVEATETSVTKETGDTKVELTARNEQNVNETADIETPAPQGVFKKLVAGVSALFSGTILYTAAERIGGMTFSNQALVMICVVVVLAFFGFMFWLALDAWKANNRVKIEAEAKTNIYRKDIQWVEPR
jgi:hypothetical protein